MAIARGSLPAPTAQWAPLLLPGARTTLAHWVAAALADASAAYAALYGPVGQSDLKENLDHMHWSTAAAVDRQPTPPGLAPVLSGPEDESQGCSRDDDGQGLSRGRHRRPLAFFLRALRARCLHGGLRHLRWHVASFLVHRQTSARHLLRTLHAGALCVSEAAQGSARGSAEPQA